MKSLLAFALLLPLTVSANEPVVVGFHGSYGYYGELWYPLHVDSTLGMGRPAIKGVDYDASVIVDETRFPQNARIAWRVPTAPPALSGVYGYPHISWGAYERSARDSDIEPKQVDNIDHLTVRIDVEQGGTPDGASILNEFYLLADPDDADSKIIEIGLFATSTSSSVALMDDSTALGRFEDPSGRVWVVSATDADVPFVMFRPLDNADVTGDVDWRAMLDFLRQTGKISGQEWFAGMAIGPEPRMGEGTVTINDFLVSYLPR